MQLLLLKPASQMLGKDTLKKINGVGRELSLVLGLLLLGLVIVLVLIRTLLIVTAKDGYAFAKHLEDEYQAANKTIKSSVSYVKRYVYVGYYSARI